MLTQKDMYAVLVKNSVYIVLSGNSVDVSPISADMRLRIFKFAKKIIKLASYHYNPMNRLATCKISPTLVCNLLASPILWLKNHQCVAAYAWNVLYKISLFA